MKRVKQKILSKRKKKMKKRKKKKKKKKSRILLYNLMTFEAGPSMTN